MNGNYPTARSHPQGLVLTEERIQKRNLDDFGIIDRSLIDYGKYQRFVGHAGVKHSVAVQATRGCPYRCFYCDIYKTTKHHFRRSDEHLFEEIRILYDSGIRRIEFIDDIFNVNVKGFARFFEFVIKNNFKIQFFFPTGLKGDLLNYELIDLMIEGGSVGVNLSLEHASPRVQTVMRKGLDVDKLHDNLQYITKNHPQAILTLNAMHGFPSETEEEARETLDYIKSIEWIDFPYLHNVRIFPGTEIEHFALEVGIPQEIIDASQDMSYHEHSPTLPFEEEFTNAIKADFLKNYVFNRQRLTERLRQQLKVFSVEELDQRYNAFFPNKRLNSVAQIIDVFKLDKQKIFPKKLVEDEDFKPNNFLRDFQKNYVDYSIKHKSDLARIKLRVSHRLLLIDASTYFETEISSREYNVLEPPLGLLALATFVNDYVHDETPVSIKIVKSKIDFNSFEELMEVVDEFGPTLIGIRAMTFYKGLFHDMVASIKNSFPNIPVISGGPYPTASYPELVFDEHIDALAVGEGETTLLDVIVAMDAVGGKWPSKQSLRCIPGIAFDDDNVQTVRLFDPHDWKKTGAGPAGKNNVISTVQI